jgi:hypothetical protein
MSKKIILFIAILLLPSSVSLAKQGCCSYHGGVDYCGSSGYYICNDGTRSPSCTCGGGYEVELTDGPACYYETYENKIDNLENKLEEKEELIIKKDKEINKLENKVSNYQTILFLIGLGVFFYFVFRK